MSNEITMPDFEQWSENLLDFSRKLPDAAQAVIKQNIVDIWNMARAYERQRMLAKVDEWEKEEWKVL